MIATSFTTSFYYDPDRTSKIQSYYNMWRVADTGKKECAFICCHIIDQIIPDDLLTPFLQISPPPCIEQGQPRKRQPFVNSTCWPIALGSGFQTRRRRKRQRCVNVCLQISLHHGLKLPQQGEANDDSCSKCSHISFGSGFKPSPKEKKCDDLLISLCVNLNVPGPLL